MLGGSKIASGSRSSPRGPARSCLRAAKPPDTPAGQLPTWSETPLEPHNLGAYLQTGTTFCLIGDPSDFEAVAVIDQADVDFVHPGAGLRSNSTNCRTRTLDGTVAAVAQIDLQVAPRELADRGDLPSRVDAFGRGPSAGNRLSGPNHVRRSFAAAPQPCRRSSENRRGEPIAFGAIMAIAGGNVSVSLVRGAQGDGSCGGPREGVAEPTIEAGRCDAIPGLREGSGAGGGAIALRRARCREAIRRGVACFAGPARSDTCSARRIRSSAARRRERRAARR